MWKWLVLLEIPWRQSALYASLWRSHHPIFGWKKALFGYGNQFDGVVLGNAPIRSLRNRVKLIKANVGKPWPFWSIAISEAIPLNDLECSSSKRWHDGMRMRLASDRCDTGGIQLNISLHFVEHSQNHHESEKRFSFPPTTKTNISTYGPASGGAPLPPEMVPICICKLFIYIYIYM